jgi:PHD/YefM family antitoxin component YafN of YafNO toxin-antitoxin module
VAGKALFDGLVMDEAENPVAVVSVGGETFYVIDDDGFRRHVDSEKIDRQVLQAMREQIAGHEDQISEGAMKMIGQEDIFTKAAIEASLKNVDNQLEALLQQGLPEDARAWMGMVGFRVVVDVHGEVVRIEQPGASGPEDE